MKAACHVCGPVAYLVPFHLIELDKGERAVHFDAECFFHPVLVTLPEKLSPGLKL